MTEKPNGLAKLEDFRAQREERPIEPVKLPKLGKTIMARRPSMTWFIVNGFVPLSLTVSRAANSSSQNFSERWEEVKKATAWKVKLLRHVMVEPPFSDDLAEIMEIEDANHVLAWAQGEIIEVPGEEGTEAKSLDTFRPGRSQPNSAVDDGGSVALPSKPIRSGVA